MSAYAEPEAATLTAPLTAADIETLLRKPSGWFARDVVRKRLYAKGFPHPFERGLWSAKAVGDWLETAGSNPGNTQPGDPRRRKKARVRHPNGYTPVADAR